MQSQSSCPILRHIQVRAMLAQSIINQVAWMCDTP
jgi:hypothetical protein